MKVRHFQQLLHQYGWRILRIKGGHTIYHHQQHGTMVLGHRPHVDVDGTRLIHLMDAFRIPREAR